MSSGLSAIVSPGRSLRGRHGSDAFGTGGFGGGGGGACLEKSSGFGAGGRVGRRGTTNEGSGRGARMRGAAGGGTVVGGGLVLAGAIGAVMTRRPSSSY
jgi:hypothetical protein